MPIEDASAGRNGRQSVLGRNIDLSLRQKLVECGAPPHAARGGTTNSGDWSANPVGYQVDDLSIDLAPRRVSRAGTVIPLRALSFDLLVTLVRAAPNLLSFEQLSERVWPGLVVSPETIVQRVKLLRSALGDDPHAPRYIEGMRGRGYRVIAGVRPLAERPGTAEFSGPSSLNETKQENPNEHAGAAVSVPLVAGPAAPLPAARGPLRWIGATLIVVMLLVMSGVIVYYRGVSKPVAPTTTDAPQAAIHSLAVLPLENLSGDTEQEYFADGMTDALTTDLAQIGSLRIISRTSAMQFKGSKETLPQIGRDLKVDAIVEGAVTRGANRVRVTAQLVEASSDHHLWARSYERDLKDVLALQDEIAQDIAEQIRVKVSPKEHSLIIQPRTVDPEVYDAYLRGMYWLDQGTQEGLDKGCDYLQKALAKDPGYAPAFAGLAECFAGHNTPVKARQAIVKALALDPSLAQAHSTLATMKIVYDWDWFGAEAEYQQGIALNPNYAPAHSGYSFELVAMGRLEEAMREIELARNLDPYSGFVAHWRGQVLYHARRYDDALRELRRGLEMHPNTGGFYSDIADVYEQKKMFAEAFVARQQALTLFKYPKVTELDEAYKRSGYQGYLLKQVEFQQGDNLPYTAHLYALLNDEPRAMAAAEEAYKRHAAGILFMRTAPEFDSIRSSPRFRELVRRIGFPEPPSDKN
jgi:TolB-like protein/DNA-binding winged helix-turn-helix (wHTH) protein/Tfp pilus assembly protein PilF